MEKIKQLFIIIVPKNPINSSWGVLDIYFYAHNNTKGIN